MTTYFISGHTDINIREFTQLYARLILEALKEPHSNFVVGDKDGTDALAQILLKQELPEDEQSRVKVFFHGDKPRNYYSTKFGNIGGFSSDEEADIAMTLCSEQDIAWLYKDREGSGVGKNILRRYTKNFPYEKWVNKKTSNKLFWNFVFNKNKEDSEIIAN